MSHVNAVSFTILIVLFLVVTLTGFVAGRWRRADDLLQMTEWGLGGRGFGTFVSWFLLGGDLYTAYTFIAVPALIYATGATGFYAVPYTVIVFPIVFVFAPRLWSVCRAHDYITPADFVRGRYGSRGLALAVAVTGILATMPYIALQLVGIQAVLTVMGVGSGSNAFVRDLPLLIAFIVLAAYTYVSGLRAPALTAFIKDLLVYVMVIVAIIYIPTRLGGWSHIFSVSADHLKAVNPKTGKPFGSLVTTPAGEWAYATLALGSALALFMYPHAITGVLATKRRDVIRRNMAILPAYSLVLALVALLGYVALADPAVRAGVKAHGSNTQLSVPLLFEHMFPSWFAGIGYSAIVIGALVPAAIMSIAAANLFTRNIYRDYFKPDASPRHETRVAQAVSLVVKIGALAFALALSKTFSINLQLLGGIWILQTFPAIVAGLYTRWFHRWALVAGWAAAMVYGTIQAYRVPVSGQANSHFGGSTAPVFGHTLYIAVAALVINLVVSVVLTLVLRALRVATGVDETRPDDYLADPEQAPDGVTATAPAARS
ncbi:MAG TPA: sodium:solute symporter [Streptosporangiaceae bacterium]